MPNRLVIDAVRLIEGIDDHDLPEALALLRRYEASLPLSLDFQDFEQELATFPKGYEPPEGCVIAGCAGDGARIVGLVCIRRLDLACCEMKRLYVAPEARGLGLGERLATASLEAARALGYRRMRLDTLEFMNEAIALYRNLGFRDIGNYNRNPVPDARFFERDLV